MSVTIHLPLYKEPQNQNVPVVDREEVQYVVDEAVPGVVVEVRPEGEGVLVIVEVEVVAGAEVVEGVLVLGEVEEEGAVEILTLLGQAVGFAAVVDGICY